MNCFRRRLGERYADACDWIDYRPDADFRPFLGLPVLTILGWEFGGSVGLGLAAAFAAFAVVIAAIVGIVAFVTWVVTQAAVDAASTIRLPEMPKVPVRPTHSPLA